MAMWVRENVPTANIMDIFANIAYMHQYADMRNDAHQKKVAHGRPKKGLIIVIFHILDHL